MAEPNTPNVALIIPNTGDLVGSWGSAALNPDFVALDGMLGGTLTIPLTNAPVTLGLPAGAIAPTAGPTQSQNALITFTGTISGDIVVTLGMPGRYTFWNKCLPLNFYVQIASSGHGTTIGLPPGKKCTVFHDGTNCDYVDMPDPGTAYDLHGATALPAWMTACTTLPYLIKDGSVFSNATYPTLGALLGSTFGGNGVTTFGVPDELARARIGYDTIGTGRLTTAISGVNGQTMGSVGGNQSMQQHTHANTLTDPGHTHTFQQWNANLALAGSPGSLPEANSTQNTGSSTTGITINNVSAGVGASQNVQPSIISFLPLIKT